MIEKIMKSLLVFIMVVLAVFLLLLLVTVFIQAFTPILCHALTDGVGYPHSWTFLGGCKVQLENGIWIPFDQLIINIPQQ